MNKTFMVSLRVVHRQWSSAQIETVLGLNASVAHSKGDPPSQRSRRLGGPADDTYCAFDLGESDSPTDEFERLVDRIEDEGRGEQLARLVESGGELSLYVTRLSEAGAFEIETDVIRRMASINCSFQFD